MKELDITKAYYLGDLNDEQRGELYDYLLSVDSTYNSIRKMDFKEVDNDLVFYDFDNDEWEWFSRDEFIEKEIELEIINTLTLFEWQPKQGDKVLYTDDLEFWHEGILLTKYNDSYIIESDEMLLYAIDIKLYEEQIKVGDWVHNSDGHVLKCKYLGLNNHPNWIKITNQDLIDKLNKL